MSNIFDVCSNTTITNFEENINQFKEGFARNYDLYSRKFKTTIEAEDLTIKRLTHGNPTMAAKFAELDEELKP